MLKCRCFEGIVYNVQKLPDFWISQNLHQIIYQTQNSTCQNSFLSYHSLSVFITHISYARIVKREKQVLWMHQSHFKMLLQNSVWYWSNIVHYPFRVFLMSCPICTITAKIRSMSYIVTSVRAKMRTVLSLRSPSTVSNTGLFVPPLDGCNACVI